MRLKGRAAEGQQQQQQRDPTRSLREQLPPEAPKSSPAQPGRVPGSSHLNPHLRLARTPQNPRSPPPSPSWGVSGYLSVGPRVEKFGLLWAIFSLQGSTPVGEREPVKGAGGVLAFLAHPESRPPG